MVTILALVAGVIAGALFYAPGFLLYATNYSKADVIVLFLGPDFSARQKHAQNLIKSGMADYLIIPAYHKIYYMEQGTLTPFSSGTQEEQIRAKNNIAAPRYFEDTHIELMDAKKEMKRYGKASAIFVSSPYHMRRIQIMVNREFSDPGQHFFSPTPYEKAPRHFFDLKSSDWKKVYREYFKIAWFMIYSLWAS